MMAALQLKKKIQRKPLDQPLGVTWTALLLFTVIGIVPVLLMVAKSFIAESGFSLQAYTVFAEARVWGLLLKSFEMAAGACLLSLILGVPFALCLARKRFYAKKVCRFLYLVPLFIPPHVHSIAWIFLFGDTGLISSRTASFIYTPFGAAVVLAMAYSPIMILMTCAGLASSNPRLDEAASLRHRPSVVLRKITLPLVRPYIAAGAVFVFIFSFFNYGVPSMLRVPSFPVEIFVRFSAFYDEPGAVALSAPLVVIALLFLLIHSALFSNSALSFAPASLQQKNREEKSTTAAFFVYLFIGITVVFPLAALGLQAENFTSFRVAWNSSSREMLTSLTLASGAATLVTILAYFLSNFMQNYPSPARRIVNMLTFLPFAFPAVLFGIGLIRLWNTEYTQYIYSTTCILVFAYLARFLPFGVRIVTASLMQTHPNVKEAAFLSGAGWLRRLFSIELPLARPALIVCWIIVFIFSMGELGATLLVIPPGTGTVALKIYTLMHYGAGPLVAALALLLIGLNLLVATGLLICSKPNAPQEG